MTSNIRNILKEKKKELSDNNVNLNGYCHENAVILAEELKKNGYSPQIIWGSLNTCDPDRDIKVLEKEIGSTHLWNSVKNRDIHLDLFRYDKNKGDILCSKEKPSNYYIYAIIDYESWMKPGHFISYDDFRFLKNKGVNIKEKH